ncbi:GNAT family N-acetyltransferase [Streptomyces yaizuensis]|uniref:GNAT family N-acetyltransferase n=1 Tax=Streptomyces yaizuensis TaxID=2989713 RepID=A0ABQ5PAS5_9ACTN|nr:GNAT family N-acetyltransferase [Streptomyces sp. YSPA8]GLF99590.1 GNAT family N-acetyltransferase [Streptomyces sp. YSPA8]
MTVIIRTFRPEDAATVSAIRRAALPCELTTPDSVLHTLRTADPAERHRRLVAEEGGVIAGVADASLVPDAHEPGQSAVAVRVDPARRGRGIGTALLRAAEEHLRAVGAREAYGWAGDEPRARAFARRHGYESLDTSHFQRLDLGRGPLPEPSALPPGTIVRTVAEYAADPRAVRAVHRADIEATTIDPADIEAGYAEYEEWLEHTWNDPLFDRELSTLVVEDGRIVSLAFVESDRAGRGMSAVTATVPEHRGRGHATAAKTAALLRARERGVTEMFTSVDTGNAAMLAINERLGYEICGSEVRQRRALG